MPTGALCWEARFKQRDRVKALIVGAVGISSASAAEVPTSTTTQQEKREETPPRLVNAKTPAQSQGVGDLERESVHTRSQSHPPSKTPSATPSATPSKSVPK